MPAVTPVTVPPVTVALPLLLLHMPPVATSVRVTGSPTHTLPAPVMVPATGRESIVITISVDELPQVLDVVNVIVAVPA